MCNHYKTLSDGRQASEGRHFYKQSILGRQTCGGMALAVQALELQAVSVGLQNWLNQAAASSL